MCGIIYCYSDDTSTINSHNNDNTASSSSSSSSSTMICNNSQKLEIILSLISNDSNDNDDDDLTNKCWEVVVAATNKGTSILKSNHINQFSEQMLRTKLSITTSNTSSSCSYNTIATRTTSFSNGCYNDTTSSITNSIDILLVGQAFQYGRYLFISSSMNTTSNLQGIWTDGPTSSWSGDYHLNINMQMIYWAADTTSMSEAMKPLIGTTTT